MKTLMNSYKNNIYQKKNQEKILTRKFKRISNLFIVYID